MKRTVGIVVGVVTVGAAIYIGSRLLAQQQPPNQGQPYPPTGGTPAAAAPVAPPQTRIALLNLNYVVQNYQKWINFRAQYKEDFKKLYEEKITLNQKALENCKKTLENPALTPTDREAWEKERKRLDREMQDIADDAKQKLAKKEMDEVVLIYHEINDAVTDYASRHGIELVMHWNEAPPQERWTPMNVGRKMGNGGCMPLYYHPGMDISDAILKSLNANVRAPAAPAPGTTLTPGRQ